MVHASNGQKEQTLQVYEHQSGLFQDKEAQVMIPYSMDFSLFWPVSSDKRGADRASSKNRCKVCCVVSISSDRPGR